jgi:zinc and cadmium transporter
MSSYLQVIFYSLIGGVFSLIGGVLLLSRKNTAMTLARYATPFAAGALLAAAFFDLLPEAVELTAEGAAFRWILGGMLAFFFLEHFLHWFHHHHEHGEKEKQAASSLIIIGDSLHNFLDGIAIGAAFLINAPIGIVTTLAVAAHEIPQEIGDFGLLLKAGYSRKNVLLINIASAFMTVIGALGIFTFGRNADLPLGELLAITAGMFIYIAGSDLIPTIHDEAKGKRMYLASVLLLLGVLSVGVIIDVVHKYLPEQHNQAIMGSCPEAIVPMETMPQEQQLVQ